MASDRITLNVGGRLFHTTRGTLEFSRAGFFEALLKRWTPASSRTVPASAADLKNSSSFPSPSPRSLKRRRQENIVWNEKESEFVEPEGGSVNGTTITANQDVGVSLTPLTPDESIFIDRDPDSFEDVLFFMRSGCIRPSTSIDPCRVKQLCMEADFLNYCALLRACQKQLESISKVLKQSETASTTSESENAASSGMNKAQSNTIILGRRGTINRPRKEITVPEGHVVYVDFCSIFGLESMPPIAAEGDNPTARVTLGCYRRSNERAMADGQRVIRSVTHLFSAQRSTDPTAFPQRIGICLSSTTANDKIGLVVSPPVRGILWQVHYWVGPPRQIPQLGGTAAGASVATEPSMEKPDRETQLLQLVLNECLDQNPLNDDDSPSGLDTSMENPH